jgi:hypothetical protein
MNRWYRTGLLAGLVAGLLMLAGCAKHEHRKMTVHEEQQEGPVEPVSPGEMVVE